MLAAVEVIESDPGIHVIIFCGNGRSFCAGGDLKEQMATLNLMDSKRRMEMAGKAALRLVNLDRPVIGMVQGNAVGAGFSLAMVGDIVYAAENARFGAVFSQVGLVPDMGTCYLLPRLVGRSRAKEMIMTGRMVPAHEAERVGLVNRVLPLEELEEQTMALAQQLAKAPPLALRLGKQNLNQMSDLGFAASLDLERHTQTVCFMTEDHQEGLAGFLEKRPPIFQGR